MYKREKLFMVVIVGPAGAGKTTLAEFLKNQLVDTAHASSDNIKRFISQFREVASHNKVSRNVVNAMVDEYLKNNINVIVEQNMDNEETEILKKIGEKNNVDFFLYRIEASKDIRRERIEERTSKSSKPMMTEMTFEKLSKRYEENSHPSNRTFDSGQLCVKEIAEFILKDLKII